MEKSSKIAANLITCTVLALTTPSSANIIPRSPFLLEKRIEKGILFDLWQDGFKESKYYLNPQRQIIGCFDSNADNKPDSYAQLIPTYNGYILNFLGVNLKFFYDKDFRVTNVNLYDKKEGPYSYNYVKLTYTKNEKELKFQDNNDIQKGAMTWRDYATLFVRPLREL